MQDPVNITSVLAHLLFLTSNGQLDSATALADTFGTPAFLAVAAAADVPQEFREDVAQRHGVDISPGTKCFDLFR